MLLLLLPWVPNRMQVLFNSDYRDTDHQLERDLVAGGDQHEVCGFKYIVQKYCGETDTPEYLKCSVPGKLSNFNWPHFALRPGVWSMSHLKKLGPLSAGNRFEHAHGLKFVEQGFKTAFLPNVNAIHLAVQATWIKTELPHIIEETYAKHGISVAALGESKSAYDLTGTFR